MAPPHTYIHINRFVRLFVEQLNALRTSGDESSAESAQRLTESTKRLVVEYKRLRCSIAESRVCAFAVSRTKLYAAMPLAIDRDKHLLEVLYHETSSL